MEISSRSFGSVKKNVILRARYIYSKFISSLILIHSHDKDFTLADYISNDKESLAYCCFYK